MKVTQEVTLLILRDVGCIFRISVGTLNIPTDVLRGFVQSLQANTRQYLKVGHCSFLQSPLKSIIHQFFFFILHYIISANDVIK
jgi:hypothetical protein